MKRVLILLAAMLLLVAGAGCGGGGGDESSDEAASSSAVPFDRAFIDAMVPHHRSAIAMAEAAKNAGLQNGQLREVADDIMESQRREIDEMLDWREEWFGSRDLGPEDRSLLGLPEAEMGAMEHGADEIEGAEDVDRAFAVAMIPHHEDAIEMAKQAQQKGQHEEIKTLADDIVEAQKREIETMKPHTSGGHEG